MYLKTPAEDSSGGWVGAEGLSKKEKEFMDKDNSMGIAGCGGGARWMEMEEGIGETWWWKKIK